MSRLILEIAETERILLAVALAQRVAELELAGRTEHANSYADLLRRLWEAPRLPEGQASAATTAATGSPRPAAVTAPGAGARSTPTASGADSVVDALKDAGIVGELTITPVSVEQDGKAMVVSYQIRTGQKTRIAKNRCWDPKLFSALVASVGQTTTFLTRESKGFLNIVGVKA